MRYDTIQGQDRCWKSLKIWKYIKMGLYKCLKTFSALKNPSLLSDYFKLIETVCKGNEELIS